MVAAPFKQCGDPIKGYTTANYANASIKDLCRTTANLAEATPNAHTTYPSKTPGERGYYYSSQF
ncbi:hypothetical protein AGMMS49525_15760 [Bacteroidia bacterium]|nr:hypothetical protein AGMMS49525_15760 [Bacteroidia bacterium]